MCCPVVPYCGSEPCCSSISRIRAQVHAQVRLTSFAGAQLTLSEEKVSGSQWQLTQQASTNDQASPDQPTRITSQGDDARLQDETDELKVQKNELESQLQQKHEEYVK